MQSYTFKSYKGVDITVQAPNEADARYIAMVRLWGTAQPPVYDNKGQGLVLL